jgi:hypothetical protein
VDVIHTDGATRLHSGFGYLEPLGHVDFYPNGGSAQPSELLRIPPQAENFSLSFHIACGENTGISVLLSAWTLISTFSIGSECYLRTSL